MNRKDLQTKNPIGAHVFFNIIILVLVLAGLGVAHVWLNMRNHGRLKEVKKLEASILNLESEIAILKMDLEKAQDNGVLSEALAKVQRNTGLELRGIDPNEPVILPMPKAVSMNK